MDNGLFLWSKLSRPHVAASREWVGSSTRILNNERFVYCILRLHQYYSLVFGLFIWYSISTLFVSITVLYMPVNSLTSHCDNLCHVQSGIQLYLRSIGCNRCTYMLIHFLMEFFTIWDWTRNLYMRDYCYHCSIYWLPCGINGHSG